MRLYINRFRNKYRQQLMFASIGGMNTLVDFAIYLTLRSVGASVLAANIVATSIALSLSYQLNRRHTFKIPSGSSRTFASFLAVTLTGLWILQPIVIYLGLQILSETNVDSQLALNTVSKIAAAPFTLLWNYTLYKRLVFKPHHAQKSPDQPLDH